jgi:hypothetical protein
MQQPMYHSAIHLKCRKIESGMLNALIPLWLLRLTCRAPVTRSTPSRCLFPQIYCPTTRQIPLLLCSLRYLIQAQRPRQRDVFGQLPHQYLHKLPMVHNGGAAVFVSVLVVASHSDQMLARLERRIVTSLKMCGHFLKVSSPRGVVFFASKAYFF